MSESNSPPAGGMSELDRRLCLDAVNVFTSQDHSAKNFLFLVPVDTTHFPTYRDIVKRPMDLGTLRANLEAGKYRTRDVFFADAMLCFQNAIAFNEGAPDRQWIVKLAKSMMKLVNKERQKAEKRAGGGTGGMQQRRASKKDRGSGESKKKLGKSKKDKDGLDDSRNAEKNPPLDKKPSLKLKLSSGGGKGQDDVQKEKKKKRSKTKKSLSPTNVTGRSDAATSTSAMSAAAVPPKSAMSIKLKPPSVSTDAAAAPTKPSVSLKLKPPSASNDAAAAPTKPSVSLKLIPPSAPTDATAASSKPSVSLKLKPPASSNDAFTAPTKPSVSLKLKPPSASTDETAASSKPSVSLKLKPPSASNDAATASAKPSVSLKLKSPSAANDAAAASPKTAASLKLKATAASGDGPATKLKKSKKDKDGGKKVTAVKAKPSQPKLKLKISLGKKKAAASEASAKPPPKPPKVVEPKPAAAAAPVKLDDSSSAKPPAKPAAKPTSTAPAALSAPSRGKELPKGVKTESPVESEQPVSKPAPKLKLSLSAPSRGKELPKSVKDTKGSSGSTKSSKSSKSSAGQKPTFSLGGKMKADASPSKKEPPPAPAAPAAKTATVQAPLPAKTAAPPPPPPPPTPSQGAGGTVTTMTPARRAQCMKVLAALKRRNQQNVSWFLKPVSDQRLIVDYRNKIPNPMDLGTIGNKLERSDGGYLSVADFVLDVRRVFANCLRYNTSVNDTFRPVARDMLSSAEEILTLFVAKPEAPLALYPPLLYCWKLCLSILDTLLNMKNPGDGHQTCHYFLHPVSFFFGGQLPPDYLTKVKTPMDLGTVTSKLFEGTYHSVGAFVADCRLIVENCKAYYGDRSDGVTFTEQAGRLHDLMKQQLGALARYDQSPAAAVAKNTPPAPIQISRPTKAFLSSMLRELRATKYTDKYTKLTETAALHFEKPVNLAIFSDYLQFVDTPMDIESVERKIEAGLYSTPEDFEYDVTLIFRNCEKYNVPKRNDHIVALAKHCQKMFRKMFSKRMSALLEGRIAESEGLKPAAVAEKKDASGKRTPPVQQGDMSKPVKKPKLDTSKPGKALPRNSITSAAGESPKEKLPSAAPRRSKSPKPSSSKRTQASTVTRKSDEPVPLHVAIAQIKDSFTTRRQYKLLESWEGACSRFFRELMRHQWISAAKPKFIFHVPVPVLFPAIKEAYEKKIKNPMDLTTAECKLLHGGIYTNPKSFVDDVALVFANAITFNRAGHDEGEPLSCAYFDASRHLLRYTRWLSLEYLSPYLTDDGHTDPPTEEGLVTTWQLTKGNKKLAREEMTAIVMKLLLDKSEEGDRYTWMEAECEKLLKSLRHQSDLKHMHFFIQPNYPADYTAFISKPMDWERVQQTLQSRRYDTFGEAVEDLRLIFSNALKYNARAQGTDTVSGRAYDAAVYMSAKLEAAIDKMLISVSDKVEREKIDRLTAEREMEAAERAEEERLRAEWQKEREQNRSSIEVKTRVETVETVRVIQPRRHHRRRDMDFDFPFYDDDEGHHEQSQMEALRQQKLIFEKQQKDRLLMQKITFDLGIRVYAKMAQRAQAIAWAKKVAAKKIAEKEMALKKAAGEKGKDGTSKGDSIGPETAPEPSNVSTEINKQGREQVKLSFGKPKKAKKRRKQLLDF